ncbi:putative CRAL-TRIO lipid binding domain, CRAL/TRIO domain superfamily [Helianthus annuus]|nr:putative CRAL-TRIO lipid binding domain, CRAL/TRIO domain superfamily [Helianthus annuus]KAJ0796441.1 putative CRAL-TRIO lipid binding domain, CRAL/TRIO domain superfamily [Helianthus annuus]
MVNKYHNSSSDSPQIEKNRIEAVLHILRKPSPLTLKQEKFCNEACVRRFLKSKGENVKKAAKQLRGCLSWRDNLGVDEFIADEFSGEIAEGMAYVAGHDDQSRPVVIFRIKQDYLKFRSQKQVTRLLVFTLEVAIQTMAKSVEQLVVLFDASKSLTLEYK